MNQRLAHTRCSQPRWAAFSLIELIMGLTISAVLAAMAVPRYNQAVARYRAEHAAHRVIADLSLAQARARALSTSQTVTFSTTGSQYQLQGMTDPDRPASTYTVPLGDAPYHCTIVSAKLGNDSALIFNGFGVPDSGGTIVVRSGANTRTITVNAESGTATMP